jgi:hypothetical protein
MSDTLLGTLSEQEQEKGYSWDQGNKFPKLRTEVELNF